MALNAVALQPEGAQMIDWVNAVLPFPHEAIDRIHGGAADYSDRHGEHTGRVLKKLLVKPGQKKADLCTYIDAEGNIVETTVKAAKDRPSSDSGIAIQSSSDEGHFREGKFSHIWISGSPKPLQRHNLFGTDNPLELAALLGRAALEAIGVKVDQFTFSRWLSGRGVKLTRIDITQMLDTGSETNAAAWIAAAAQQVSLKHRPNARSDEGTIYFGKNSRRWALKLYQKFPEITCASRKHKLPEDIEQRDALLDYAQGTVRSELVLHSMQLKHIGLQDGHIWASKPVNSFEVWGEYMKKIELSGNVRLHHSVVESLPRALRGTYALWNSGENVKRILTSNNGKNRMTFYRHRKALLAYGVDISKPKVQGNNVVPILRVIEALPKQIPSWAHNTPLLARAA